jgi:surface polysaccharide O-acyltransferase-like enzyme
VHKLNLINLLRLKESVGDTGESGLDPATGKLYLPVDLIRTFAIVLVIMLHAGTEPVTIANQMSPEGVTLWWTTNIYDSLARPAVPLFVMLSGALLLQPAKLGESLSVFFKKRLNRIALPFLFWGVAYFAWRFFVHGEALSADSIVQGVLTGPYVHFWFLYMLVGLYLITPVLRVVVAYVDRKTFSFLLMLWFFGTSIAPVLGLLSEYHLNTNVFIVTGWVGYFLIGAYLLKVRERSAVLSALLVLGLTWTIIGTYLIVGTIGERVSQFFYDASSFSMIGASVALFLLLAAVPSNMLEERFPRGSRVLRLISQNTIPIYLFHMMVLEALQRGFFGFQISLSTINPVLEVPLITVVTLLICLGVIYPLKRMPVVKKLIG